MATDPDSDNFEVIPEVETRYSRVLKTEIQDNLVYLDVDMAAFYAGSLMTEYEKDVDTKVSLELNDGVNEVVIEIPVIFKGKKAPPPPPV